MSPYVHAEISVKKRGGQISDYYHIHSFLDSTKEICSDNRHRILHTLWGVRRVVLPIFGATITNSAGKRVNVKDLCEQDHILPDYRNKFIPTIADFVREFEELSEEEFSIIDEVYASFKGEKEIQELLISPLNATGQLKALRITHNTWFCNEIIPRIFGTDRELKELGAVSLFEKMGFRLWMDNGAELPPSAIKMKKFL